MLHHGLRCNCELYYHGMTQQSDAILHKRLKTRDLTLHTLVVPALQYVKKQGDVPYWLQRLAEGCPVDE
jgi:hypothetical protein